MLEHAVIAAAGYGSRLDRGIPKSLALVNGRTIIEYQLALLKDVPDVRIVAGYQAEKLTAFVKALRPDVKVIVNKDFDTTNTLQSYFLGCHDLHGFFLLLDGDIIPSQKGFQRFKDHTGGNLIGIAPVVTEDAVYVHLNDRREITAFSRTDASAYEWSNIAVLHSDLLAWENTYVYQRLEKFLPLQAMVIERLEVDTPADLKFAEDVLRGDPEYRGNSGGSHG